MVVIVEGARERRKAVKRTWTAEKSRVVELGMVWEVRGVPSWVIWMWCFWSFARGTGCTSVV